MRWNDEITLIAIQQPEQPVDANGFPQPPSEEKRTLFANVRKVGMTEFSNGRGLHGGIRRSGYRGV